MERLDSPSPRLQRGFSLPEIMVGMVIGLLGTIIMMQTTSVFEARKGHTTSGDDAQNGGAIALFGMQKDITQAGYGVSSPLLINTGLVTPQVFIPNFFPVIVNPIALAAVGDPGTDTILVTYGSSTTSEGILIDNTTATLPYLVARGTGTRGQNDGGRGVSIGDWVIPSQNGVTGTQALPHSAYSVAAPPGPGVVQLDPTNPPAPGLIKSINNPNKPLLFNLGPNPALLAYAVIGGSLSVCDYWLNNCGVAGAPQWQPLAGNIVNMRAACEGQAGAPGVGGVGLRIALVNRSTQRDAGVITNAVPTWNPNGIAAPVTLNPAAWGQDWNQYRYKTFESVVPLRNPIWNGVRGC